VLGYQYYSSFFCKKSRCRTGFRWLIGRLIIAARKNFPVHSSHAETVMPDITLAQAKIVVDAAFAKALELGAKMNITVVDAGTIIKAFVRMDGAWLGSADVSIRKARTARLFDMPTGEIGKLSQPGGSLFNIEHSNGGLITFPGGVPLVNAAGEVIGAIGVSGSIVENDHAVACAGAAAVK
jgi:uncharacterized protein GlcG (DUF336 family)